VHRHEGASAQSSGHNIGMPGQRPTNNRTAASYWSWSRGSWSRTVGSIERGFFLDGEGEYGGMWACGSRARESVGGPDQKSKQQQIGSVKKRQNENCPKPLLRDPKNVDGKRSTRPCSIHARGSCV